jgi:hypothetical protein
MPRRYVVTMVHGNMIIDGTITTNKLADQAVTTPKLADQAVTTAKLAPTAVRLPLITASKTVGISAGTIYNYTPALLQSIISNTDEPSAGEAITIKELWIAIRENTLSNLTEVTFLKNFTDTTKKISIPAGTTGGFSETSTPISLTPANGFSVKIRAYGSSGYIRVGALYVYKE